MNAQFTFTEEEKNKIKQAVIEAEAKTSGEIVPYFVQQSGNYEESYWRSAFLLGFAIVMAIVFFSFQWKLSIPVSPVELGIAFLGANIIGYTLARYLPFLKRSFVQGNKMNEQIEKRACKAFISEEIFNTRDRTGILIFISKFERMVYVLADSGINNKVKPEDWQHVVETITNGIKKKQTANSIAEAIAMCGDLLLNAGFVIKEDDTNELPDDIRMG